MPRLEDIVSSVIVDTKNPGDEASYIIKACKNAIITQKNWKK